MPAIEKLNTITKHYTHASVGPLPCHRDSCLGLFFVPVFFPARSSRRITNRSEVVGNLALRESACRNYFSSAASISPSRPLSQLPSSFLLLSSSVVESADGGGERARPMQFRSLLRNWPFCCTVSSGYKRAPNLNYQGEFLIGN